MAKTLANLRLQTKSLLSMVLVIAGLTWVALLVVRQTVLERAQQLKQKERFPPDGGQDNTQMRRTRNNMR